MALLGDLVNIKGGGTPSRKVQEYWGGNIPWATVKDFKSFELSMTQEKITDLGVDKSATNIVPAGTIVVPTRMAVGKAAITSVDMAINQDLKALLIKDENEVDQNFLLRFLLAKSSFLERMGKGATVKGITLDVLRDLVIPLPSLKEQKRIAAILDKADGLRRKRQQAIELADEFLRAVFLDMFGDPQNPDNATHSLGSIADIVMGQSPPGTTYNETGNGKSLINGPVEFGKKHPFDRQWTTAPKKLSKAGDILFCVRGATAGKLNWSDKEYCIGRGVAALRPVNESISGFLYNVLNLSYDVFQRQGVGSTFINISKEDLNAFKVPVATQKEYKKFDSIVNRIENYKEKVEDGLLSSGDIFKSLSQKAFAGEL